MRNLITQPATNPPIGIKESMGGRSKMEGEIILGSVATLISTLGGFFLTKHSSRLEKIEEDTHGLEKDLSNYKLEASQKFAREETMQTSLSRIHDRLDRTAKSEDIASLRSEIKEALLRK